MLKLLPYKIGSRSAKLLAESLGAKRIIPGGNFQPRRNTVVINWGNSTPHFNTNNCQTFNDPSAVAIAKNKLKTFQHLSTFNIPIVPWTTDFNVAKSWQEDDYRVVCRHLLEANSGKGIQIIQPDEEIPSAPLYTKYTKKQKEFRIHVLGDQIIDAIEKRKRNGISEDDGFQSLIRSYENGWVFCRDRLVVPELVKNLAINAVIALGLDFGAVDIIWRDGKAWVLEVNTAPGLEGTTLERYTNAFMEVINALP